MPVFAKKRPAPNFAPRAYFRLRIGPTDAEKHGESKKNAKNIQKREMKKENEKSNSKQLPLILSPNDLDVKIA